MQHEFDPLRMATEMMKSALVLLDAVRQRRAANLLQHALDVVQGKPVATSADEIEAGDA